MRAPSIATANWRWSACATGSPVLSPSAGRASRRLPAPPRGHDGWRPSAARAIGSAPDGGPTARTEGMDEGIELQTLEDGAQNATQVAELVAGFLDAARESLLLALYDIRLPGEVGDRIREALVGAAQRGVNVRLAYNHDTPRNPE